MNNQEQLTLWLGAFRYYCGRMTYAVSDFCSLLIKEWPNLPDNAKMFIQKELESMFERDDKYRPADQYAPLGGDSDRKEWEAVRELWSK